MPMQPMPEPQNTPEARAHPHAPQATSPSGVGSNATPQAALRRAHATQHSQALPFGSPIATPQSMLNPAHQAPPLPCPDTAMCAVSEPEDFRAAEGDVEMQEAGIEDQAQNPQTPQDRMAGGVPPPGPGMGDAVAGGAAAAGEAAAGGPAGGNAHGDSGQAGAAAAAVAAATAEADTRRMANRSTRDEQPRDPREDLLTVTPAFLNAIIEDAVRRGRMDAATRDAQIAAGAQQAQVMHTPSPTPVMHAPAQPQLMQSPGQETLLQRIAAVAPSGTQVVIVRDGLPIANTLAAPAIAPPATQAAQAVTLAKSSYYRPSKLDEKKLEQCRGAGGADRLRRHLDLLKLGIERSGGCFPDDIVLFLDVCPLQDFVLAQLTENKQSGKPFVYEDFKDALVRFFCGEVRSTASIALDEILNGLVTQGRDPVAVYAERFRQKALLLPDESPQSLCAHFLRGMDPELRGYCCLDDKHREWKDLDGLLGHSRTQELRWQPHKLGRIDNQSSCNAAARPKDSKRPRYNHDQNPSTLAVAMCNAGAGTSRANVAAPAAPAAHLAAVSANPSTNGNAQSSRQGPKLSQPITLATDPARTNPLPMGSFVGSKGTMYNREAWMYKDPLCPVNLCDGYGTKDRLAGAAGDVIKRELTLFNLCWRCRVSRDHRAENCPKKAEDGFTPVTAKGRGIGKADKRKAGY